jgi:hypothetical protein
MLSSVESMGELKSHSESHQEDLHRVFPVDEVQLIKQLVKLNDASVGNLHAIESIFSSRELAGF